MTVVVEMVVACREARMVGEGMAAVVKDEVEEAAVVTEAAGVGLEARVAAARVEETVTAVAMAVA